MAENDSTATQRGLNAEEVTMVRRALLVGLNSYGEIVRLQNAAEIAKLCNAPIPANMEPIDPTGSATTVCEFAEALRAMEHAEVSHG